MSLKLVAKRTGRGLGAFKHEHREVQSPILFLCFIASTLVQVR